MDKNIAALLREDARTVHVVFPYENGGLGDGSGMPKTSNTQLAHPNAIRTNAGMFADGRPLYTYVTDLDLKVDDYVAVPARGQFKIAQVKGVDSEVLIEPNSDITYAWVIDRVDAARWDANTERNRLIESTVAAAYKKRVKKSFAREILGELGDNADAAKLTALLQGPKNG